jgi:protease I
MLLFKCRHQACRQKKEAFARRGGSVRCAPQAHIILMRKKLLIVTDDAGESQEIYYAKHRFAEEGWQPVIAASQKKLLNGVIHDFAPGWNTYIEKPGYLIQADVAFTQVKAAAYDAMLLIGGRAPEFLRHDDRLLKLVRQFYQQGKWLLAICHGIQILVAAGLVKGRTVTCYCNVRNEVELAGGTWKDSQSVVDTEARIITAQTWESHPDFYRDVFAHLQ